ncbi:addiction module protein [Thiomicrorhabdus sp. Milos-T2]|uniref:addiction module protein n=1 Tax=Thiomicrorhabdus sp. Milos-T2 TaxID=90814 RepID=UPI0004945C38|nr:addiction module protein [Thiomicrorhabdus sp. Milos-T2]
MLIDTKKIDKLPLSGQIELMEAVMGALGQNQTDFEPPAWHLDDLEARAQELNEPEKWLTFEEVRETLKS